MTPEERQLITGLFDRMRSHGAPEKDREAETLINQSVRSNPDAAYMLVQSVLIQEQGLQAANERVQELEEQLRSMEGAEPPRSARSGSFLGGGAWGGRSGEDARSSVPQVGARATPSAYEGRTSSPWTQQGAPPPQQQQPAPAASGGGFLRSALTTAAGVAGGMLVADSLRNMLGGAHASPSSSPLAGPREDRDAKYVDESDNDPGTADDADNDPGLDSGGGDDGIEV